MDLLIFASLASIVIVVRRIRIAQQWVWGVLFLCVSDTFSFYPVSCFWSWCNCYQLTDQIPLMMSLTVMDTTPGPLVRALSLFVLKIPLVMLTIPLVVFVAWVLAFFPNRNRVNLWLFPVGRVCTNMSRVQRWSTHWNILVPKVLISPPILKIIFIAIV